MNKLSIFSVCLFFILLNACAPPPIFDETPALEWGHFTKDTVQQFSGQVSIVVKFTDGDGDLGSIEGDSVPNMIIIDSRTDDTIFYKIPYIPPQGAANGISGEIEVDLPLTCCIIPGYPILCSDVPNTYDSIVYKVQIKDQKDRWSNVIESSPLRVRCFQ